MTRIPKTSLRLCAVFAGVVLALSTAAVVSASVVGKTGLFDHGVIAYVSDCLLDRGNLYQLDVAHRVRHQLSDRSRRIYSLTYAEGGAWLVYEVMERNPQGDFNRIVYAIDLIANREHPLVSESSLVPVNAANRPISMSNIVGADTAPDGYAVRSRLESGRFDLYIEATRSTAPVRLTDDDCVERYPRWRPAH
jgi:hypothetical protein